jgi:hypothetical protein
MYKNTKQFFKEVAKGNATNIDIKNYIKLITENHKIEHLKTLKKDLEFFIFQYREELESNINKNDIELKIKYYKDKGLEIPQKKEKNIMRFLKEKKGLSIESEPEYNIYLDMEKIFYPYELFTLRQIDNYINGIIENSINGKQNTKHEHIFSNNGFILFEYILNKFVGQNRGRKTDIAFYYWSMYNDKKKYIHQRPEQFKKWFFDTYNNEDLGQLKTYDNAKNKNRLINYSTALDWFNTK